MTSAVQSGGSNSRSCDVELSDSVVSWRYLGRYAGILCYMGFKEVLWSFIAPSSMCTVLLTPVVMVFQEVLGCLCIFHACSSSRLAGRGSHRFVILDSFVESLLVLVGSYEVIAGKGYLRNVFDVVWVLHMCCVSFVASSKVFGKLPLPFMFCPALNAFVLGHSSR